MKQPSFETWYSPPRTQARPASESAEPSLPAPAAYACLAARSPITGNTIFFP